MAQAGQVITPMPRHAGCVGKVGKKVTVAGNFFSLNFANLPEIYQYDVKLYVDKSTGGKDAALTDVASTQPVAINRRVFKRFIDSAASRYSGLVAYDGRNIAYSAVQLSLPEQCRKAPYFPVLSDDEGNAPSNEDKGRAKNVHVAVEASATIQTRTALQGTTSSTLAYSQPFLNALDVAIAMGNTERFVEVGRSFYSKVNARPLGGGVQAWRGFYQSVRLTQNGLAINLDESFTPFWTGGDLYTICKAANNNVDISPKDSKAWKRLGKDLHGVRLRAQHTRITYRLFGFSDKSANEISFADNSTGRSVTIADYVSSQYGVRLQFPDYPCVKAHPTKKTFIPMELLHICDNQRRGKAMDAAQTSAMIKVAALRPPDLRQSVERSMRLANHNNDPTCKAFKLKIGAQPTPIQARVLPTPSLEYASNNPKRKATMKIEVRNGAWNMANLRALQGMQVVHWLPIRVGGGRDDMLCQDFLNCLTRTGRENGVPFSAVPNLVNLREGAVESTLHRVIEERNQTLVDSRQRRLQLVVVMKERQDNTVYNSVKRVCDVRLGIASQCVLVKKLAQQRGNKMAQYCANLLLKINAKLGGRNALVTPYERTKAPNPPFMDRPYIVLGADVSHPSPGPGVRPSIAALVGSKDRHCIQFTGSIRNQNPRQEIIGDLSGMFLEVYRKWFDNFNPRVHAEAIVMFRDGVSEGQYQQVLDVELKAIRTACQNVCKFNPKITYVIVTKRHHARFFGAPNTLPRDLDRNGNIVAGTVIDSGVTNPNTWEFYLNSHAGLQGTNKPAKYTVLWDENKLNADQLQGYIYRLAHGFARCTRSVSMVNAAYYAHLLAFRGRVYLGEEESDHGSVGGDHENVIPAAMKPHPNVAGNLFFV